jgi:hypothetical protein
MKAKDGIATSGAETGLTPLTRLPEVLKVWKMVKNSLPFFGALPFLRMSPGSIRTSPPLSTRGQRGQPGHSGQ